MHDSQILRVSLGEEQLKGLDIDAPTPRPDPKPVPPYTGKRYRGIAKTCLEFIWYSS